MTYIGIRCTWFLHVLEFWPKARLASISTHVDVVSASTIWTPTLTLASSDVDANFSDLHALQSPEFWEQASSPIGELSPTIRKFGASSGHLQRLGDSWSIREGFPDLSLVSTLVKNPEEGVIGGFLGLPKGSFTAILDPLVELGVNALDAEIPSVRPAILSSTPGTARDRRQDLPPWNASEESSGLKFQFPHLELVGIGLLEAIGEQRKETRALLAARSFLEALREFEILCRPALECVDLLSQFLKLAVLGTGSSVDLLYECVDLLSQFLKLAVLGTGSSVDPLYECVDLGVVGEDTLAVEAVETDSERVD
ncbi:hypothetical protein Taro_011871 [Colocasia esculenta]|uniref:Uncharacterized protein n=1 Tax=Colocasia esculenta TaxID=4460 RepID=A0A843UBA5_COLES|nr:hypothetical protein [Colocasia esculenta]